jgi:hypothetical protein
VNDNLLPERSRIVEEHLAAAGITAPIHELPASTRTAAEAAEALGCEVGAIASSLLFVADDEPVLVMTSGRHRVDPVQLGAALGVDDVRLASAERVRSSDRGRRSHRPPRTDQNRHRPDAAATLDDLGCRGNPPTPSWR